MAGRADVDARRLDAVLRAALVAAGLRCFLLRDGHERLRSIARGRLTWSARRPRGSGGRGRRRRACRRTPASAVSSSSIASRSRWFVGSSRTRQLTPRAAARRGARASARPGESVAQGRTTWSAPRSNFASRVRASPAADRCARVNASSSGSVARRRPARRWSRLPTTVERPSSRLPAVSGSSPSRSASSVVLPLPFRPGDRDPLAGARSRSIGPSRKSPALAHGALERRDAVAGHAAPTPSERCSRHGSYGFSTRSIRSSAPLGLAHLPRRRLRPAPVGAARRVREEAAARARLVAPRVQERLDLAPTLLRVARRRRTAAAGPARVRPRSRSSRRRAPGRGPSTGRSRRSASQCGRGRRGRARRRRGRPRSSSTKRSSRSSPSKSRSFVGSSSSRTSKRESRIAASAGPRRLAARERRRLPGRASTESPSSARRCARACSRSAPPSARKRSSAAAYASGLQSAVWRSTPLRPPRRRCGGPGTRAASRRPAVVLLRQVADGQRRRRPLDACPRQARRARPAGGAASTCRPRSGRRGRAASAARASGRHGRGRCGRRTSGRRRGARRARSPPEDVGRGRGAGAPEETSGSRLVRHGQGAGAPPQAYYRRSRSSSSADQRGSGVSSACVCGSTFRSLPQTGQRPAQSGACRI